VQAVTALRSSTLVCLVVLVAPAMPAWARDEPGDISPLGGSTDEGGAENVDIMLRVRLFVGFMF